MNQFLEIIELRTAGQNREKLERALEKLIAELNANPEQKHVQVYNSLVVESDFCIHLHVLPENSNSKGSPLGLRIVSILEEYGLVHHNIWCEMPCRALKANREKQAI
jgi:hypothetical protein